MTRSFHRLLILTGTCLLIVSPLSAAVEGTPPAAGSTKAALRSQHIKERIDSLFKHRLKPEPLPVILPNPFLVIGGVMDTGRIEEGESSPRVEPGENVPDRATTPEAATPEEAPVSDEASVLARHILSLKIGGTVQLNGQLRIIINQAPRKEGDLIFMDKKDSVTYLKVIRVTPFELTLGFNEAVQTIRLKN